MMWCCEVFKIFNISTKVLFRSRTLISEIFDVFIGVLFRTSVLFEDY